MRKSARRCGTRRTFLINDDARFAPACFRPEGALIPARAYVRIFSFSSESPSLWTNRPSALISSAITGEEKVFRYGEITYRRSRSRCSRFNDATFCANFQPRASPSSSPLPASPLRRLFNQRRANATNTRTFRHVELLMAFCLVCRDAAT